MQGGYENNNFSVMTKTHNIELTDKICHFLNINLYCTKSAINELFCGPQLQSQKQADGKKKRTRAKIGHLRLLADKKKHLTGTAPNKKSTLVVCSSAKKKTFARCRAEQKLHM